jgi:hypothetical protein
MRTTNRWVIAIAGVRGRSAFVPLDVLQRDPHFEM